MIADGEEEVVAGDENADDLAVLPPVIKTSMVIDEEDGRGMNYEEIAEEVLLHERCGNTSPTSPLPLSHANSPSSPSAARSHSSSAPRHRSPAASTRCRPPITVQTMGLPNAASGDLSSQMEVDAFRRLFPIQFYERHLTESIRPDGRSLGKARDTTIALGPVSSANGSALAKIGSTTMLAAIKMEVMTPSVESPDEGCIALDFHMPPVCSPIVRPGRPAEAAPVISKQLSDTISRYHFTFFCNFALTYCNLQLIFFEQMWMPIKR
uniref:Ribosomal RNA-processing protein 43 n=1 Tax=Cucumis sativus TaxID=3659 RepID=A0A0A0KZP2_CUCSA